MSTEELDVLVVGAGLSGIGAGYFLQTQCPQLSYAILEGRDSIGGTWDLFRYPGIRSDSDMFTLGFSFRPWRGEKAIADGPSILKYMRDVAAEFGIDRRVRLRHWVRSAQWSSQDARWTVEVEVGPEKTLTRYSCRFLYSCGGYYSYESGFAPQFPGMDQFKGQIVHPQYWPEDLDYSGKRVVVIGSGATAVTLVPSMAGKAAHVTMLQRSPTYVINQPDRDSMVNALRHVLPERMVYMLGRWKYLLLTQAFYHFCRFAPNLARKLLRLLTKLQLPRGYEVDKHFNPKYQPWDQRLCVVPNGDLFKAIKRGEASIVTDEIASFTPTGVRLKSGSELPADIIVTATGLKLVPCGGITLSVDGRPVDLAKTYTYRGLLLGDVPNFAFCVGYVNASWTLRAELSSQLVCRILNHMSEHGYTQVVAKVDDPTMEMRPLLDLSAGYVLRATDTFPKQGVRAPWQYRQNFFVERLAMNRTSLERDDVLHFSKGGAAVASPSKSKLAA
jgi:cation diffusion facilitator CzcD-associated flavoprotein CzcO